MPKGVLQEIGEQLRQKLRVTADRDVRSNPRAQGLSRVLGGGLTSEPNPLHNGGKVDRLEPRPARAPLDLADPQEGVECA